MYIEYCLINSLDFCPLYIYIDFDTVVRTWNLGTPQTWHALSCLCIWHTTCHGRTTFWGVESEISSCVREYGAYRGTSMDFLHCNKMQWDKPPQRMFSSCSSCTFVTDLRPCLNLCEPVHCEFSDWSLWLGATEVHQLCCQDSLSFEILQVAPKGRTNVSTLSHEDTYNRYSIVHSSFGILLRERNIANIRCVPSEVQPGRMLWFVSAWKARGFKGCCIV